MMHNAQYSLRSQICPTPIHVIVPQRRFLRPQHPRQNRLKNQLRSRRQNQVQSLRWLLFQLRRLIQRQVATTMMSDGLHNLVTTKMLNLV